MSATFSLLQLARHSISAKFSTKSRVIPSSTSATFLAGQFLRLRWMCLLSDSFMSLTNDDWWHWYNYFADAGYLHPIILGYFLSHQANACVDRFHVET